ncbi:hypothetical protein C8J56DRAFT_568665 [Mycena floridula]|nr:hypothetical protein C8J56DRAFT_568665 [Mycena floridula]
MQTQFTGNHLGDVHDSDVLELRRRGIFADFATRLAKWVGRSQSHRERLRIVEWDDISFLPAPEVVVGDDYRIFTAIFRGIPVLVKAYEGTGSRQRIKADLGINHSFQHPNLLRVVAACKKAQIPFIVFKMPIHSFPPATGVLSGFRTLTCYLAAALRDGDQQCLVRAVQFMRDVSSGFSHLESTWKLEQFALSKTAFDLLVDANNNVCVSVGLVEGHKDAERSTVTNEWFDVFQDLCARNLREANEECHSDFRQRRLLVGVPEAARTPPQILAESLISPQPSTVPEHPPRREYAFVPESMSDRPSLKEINKDFARFMRDLGLGTTSASNIEHLRRDVRLPTTVQHRCPGYRRQEMSIATSVSRTAIISHFTPSIQEICQVCKQEVEAGTFRCPCGQADDGVAPTVQCDECLVWSHHGCHPCCQRRPAIHML